MGKALVLPNCDFSANKIKIINFAEVHCTGITLPASATVKAGMETTIEPTLVPANTTDVVTWSSSDPSVATVSGGGVVKGINDGTATVTATCNGHSATCDVTVQSIKLFAKGGMPTALIMSGNLVDTATSTNNTSTVFNVAFGASDGKLPVYGISTDVEREWASNLYPLKIPEGTTKITVSCPNFAPLIMYYSAEEKSTRVDKSEYKVRDCARVLWGETPASGTEWSISSWTYNTRTFTLPAIDGIDSITLGLHAKNQTVYDSFDPSAVQLTFE